MMPLYYEDLFDDQTPTAVRLARINSIITFLGFNPVTQEAVLDKWMRQLDPDVNRWASPETYRLIPGIERIESQLLLYDEPTSELDPVMAATISEIIGTLKDEYSVTSMVVTHDRELALTIAERVGILMDGELIFLGTPAELRKNQDPRIVDFLNPKIDTKHPRFKNLAKEEKGKS